jgi:hypothetical protein
MCQSNTAALCKSNGKDTIQTVSGTAWQRNGVGAELERHVMCGLAFRFPEINPLTPDLNPSAQRCLPRFLPWILILKGLTARRLYKSFGVNGLRHAKRLKSWLAVGKVSTLKKTYGYTQNQIRQIRSSKVKVKVTQ